jgi:hypothetical protein
VIAYASRTGTRVNLDALRAAGWRLMISATGVHRTEAFRYAIDNGAWTAFAQRRPWDEAAFRQLVTNLGAAADFIVVPDIVAGGLESLRVSERWLPELDGIGKRRLIAVQDGMTPADIRPLIGGDVGIFVGGSTNFKIMTMGRWADLARECGAYCHVGRVNTEPRIRMCGRHGVDSFDGTSASRYSVTLQKLEHARAFWTEYGRLRLWGSAMCGRDC